MAEGVAGSSDSNRGETAFDERADKARIEHLNALLSAIRSVNQLIIRERSPKTLVRKACEILVASPGFDTSCIIICEGGHVEDVACAGAAIKLRPLMRLLEAHALPGCVKHLMEALSPAVRWNVADACAGCPVNVDCGRERDLVAIRLDSAGTVFGAMLVVRSPGMVTTAEENALLTEMAGDIAFALKSIEVEAERARAVEGLKLFRALIEQSNDTLEVVDPATGRIVDVNERGCLDHGYTRDEYLALSLFDIDPMVDAPKFKSAVEALRRSGAMTWHGMHRRKDGSMFPVEVNVRYVRLDRDYLVSVVRDVTERKEAEAEQRRVETHLRQSQRLESVGRLAGGVAHDFNNLLSVIINYADFAVDELHDADPIRKDIVEIRDAGRRAAALTRQLLAISRQQVVNPVVLDRHGVITGIERILCRLLGEDIEIGIHLADELWRVKADPGQIEQVIMNLAINARDAMPQGGSLAIETGNVRLDEAYARQHVGVEPGQFVLLSVTDTGCGMDADTREHIFEPFFTTKEKGKGTGLGLSTVYGIVKQSGGNIWVYSEPNRGTTFKAYFPRVDAPATEARRRSSSVMTTGDETVLVAEDDDTVRKLTERILTTAGYTVLSAANGGEALLLCEQHKGTVHLLLADVVMPQMSGPGLAQRLRKIRPEMRVLFMSGYTDNAIVHHGLLDPGTHFISKPFSVADLTRRVREVLDENNANGGPSIPP